MFVKYSKLTDTTLFYHRFSGTSFIVLPNVFIVHYPHAPSVDIGKFRKSSVYRKCLLDMKKAFLEEMKIKYGDPDKT